MIMKEPNLQEAEELMKQMKALFNGAPFICLFATNLTKGEYSLGVCSNVSDIAGFTMIKDFVAAYEKQGQGRTPQSDN